MNEIVIYKTGNNQIEVSVQFENETLWLNLSQISLLFERDKSVISRHINNIFKTEELIKDSVVAKNATTAKDGKTYQVEFFNLDAVLSVGYRVNSKQGTRFRQWASGVLREHLTRGYSLSRERFEANARELEAALELVRKTAKMLRIDSETAPRNKHPTL